MTTTSCPPPEGGSRVADGGSTVADGGRRVARTAAMIGVAALASLFLAACGGDSDNPVPTPSPPAPAPAPTASDEVPASAAATDASLEAYALGLPLSDTTEPLKLDNVPTFPSSETEEPIAVP